MTCASVRERLAAYLDGDLDPAAHGAVREHTAGCQSCREALRQADPLMIFADLSEQSRPAASWDGFWEGIQTALPRAPQAPARSAGSQRRVAAVLAAAAALLVLASAYILTARLQPGEAPPAVVAMARPAVPAGTPLPQTVEQVNTPGARPVQVFSMAYDPGASESPAAGEAPVTELVLIVDAGLEL